MRTRTAASARGSGCSGTIVSEPATQARPRAARFDRPGDARGGAEVERVAPQVRVVRNARERHPRGRVGRRRAAEVFRGLERAVSTTSAAPVGPDDAHGVGTVLGAEVDDRARRGLDPRAADHEASARRDRVAGLTGPAQRPSSRPPSRRRPRAAPRRAGACGRSGSAARRTRTRCRHRARRRRSPARIGRPAAAQLVTSARPTIGSTRHSGSPHGSEAGGKRGALRSGVTGH